jgi:hypothetical protein
MTNLLSGNINIGYPATTNLLSQGEIYSKLKKVFYKNNVRDQKSPTLRIQLHQKPLYHNKRASSCKEKKGKI